MPGNSHPMIRPPMRDPGADDAVGLVDACTAPFDGHDTAAVLGALTSLVTMTLADTGVPIDVFVEALRGSAAHLANLRKGKR